MHYQFYSMMLQLMMQLVMMLQIVIEKWLQVHGSRTMTQLNVGAIAVQLFSISIFF